MVSNDRRGFTLVEVLVAIAIISLAIGISSYMINAFRMNTRAQRESEGLVQARSVLDSLRGLWVDVNLFSTAVLPNLKLPSGYSLTIDLSSQYSMNPTTKAALTLNSSQTSVYTSFDNTINQVTWSKTGTVDANTRLRQVSIKIKDSSSSDQPEVVLNTLIVRPVVN